MTTFWQIVLLGAMTPVLWAIGRWLFLLVDRVFAEPTHTRALAHLDVSPNKLPRGCSNAARPFDREVQSAIQRSSVALDKQSVGGER
jgi:hypothetical protein